METGIQIKAPDGVVIDRAGHGHIVIRVPKKLVLADPIEVVYHTGRTATSVIIEEGAEAKLMEHYTGDEGETDAATEISLAAGGMLDHFRFQEEGIGVMHRGFLKSRQGRDSRFRSYVYNLGGKNTRSDISAVLNEEGAACELQGLYAANGSQKVDNQTTIDHATPHGTSSELYKGILSGASEGTFSGKIIVRPGAQKTEARQMNKNLLLSKDAIVNSQPFLEILANDVKCTHGATIGRLDEQALFYLRSRGFSEERAKALLTHAFAGEMLKCVPWEGWRAKIEAALARRIGVLLEAA
jgi:Fe-S cluster assembly protein SufD